MILLTLSHDTLLRTVFPETGVKADPIPDQEGFPQFYRYLHQKHPLISPVQAAKALGEVPALLCTLADKGFYRNALVLDDHRVSILYLPEKVFLTKLDAIFQSFGHVCAFPVEMEGEENAIWQVQVQGISALGRQAWFLLRRWEDVPQEFVELYGGRTLARDGTEWTVYQLIPEESDSLAASLSPWMQNLLQDPYWKQLDVSALTLEQCQKSELVRSLLHQRETVYLCVYPLPEKKIVWKYLFWA